MAAGQDLDINGLRVENDPADCTLRVTVHPLEASVLRLRQLLEQLYAHPCCSDTAATAYSLACDVLSCAASSCELWRAQLLRHHTEGSHGG